MTDTDALKKARELAKRRASSAFENEIAAELMRAFAAGLVAGHQMRGLQAINEQCRIQKEAGLLEKGRG